MVAWLKSFYKTLVYFGYFLKVWAIDHWDKSFLSLQHTLETEWDAEFDLARESDDVLWTLVEREEMP